MDESSEDPRLPHLANPSQFVSLDQLAELGVLYWKLNPNDYENDQELKNIREARGYNYMVLLISIIHIQFLFPRNTVMW